MKELTWKPILFNLTEARGEIRDIHERLHFLEFGKLPEEEEPSPGDARDAKYIACLERQEKRNPFTESTLFFGLEHAYHHLNWAWNCRRTPEERVWHFTDSDADRWNRFPDTAAFADLWPSDRTVKGHIDELRRKKSALHLSGLPYVWRKGNSTSFAILWRRNLARIGLAPKGFIPRSAHSHLRKRILPAACIASMLN